MSQDFNFVHQSVLYEESLEALRIEAGGIYVDCTAGGGGHSLGILDRLGGQGKLISLDQDDEALKACEDRRKLRQDRDTWLLIKANFSEITKVLEQLEIKAVDGILADLGVSSHQLDTAYRGFSYMEEGPLDMRMDQSQPLTAEIVVNHYSQEQLSRLLREYGEERFSNKIAAAIVKARAVTPIQTTNQLVEIITRAMPAKSRYEDKHPCRRSFQALRIEVNHELEVISSLLDQSLPLLRSKGRLALISFHSLEDRLIKERFRSWEEACVCPRQFPVCVCGHKAAGKVITRRPILAKDLEAEQNRRARSAKLRVFEKGEINRDV